MTVTKDVRKVLENFQKRNVDRIPEVMLVSNI